MFHIMHTSVIKALRIKCMYIEHSSHNKKKTFLSGIHSRFSNMLQNSLSAGYISIQCFTCYFQTGVTVLFAESV